MGSIVDEMEFGHRKLLIKYLFGGTARILSTGFGIYLILCGISNLCPPKHPSGWPDVVKFALIQLREIYEDLKAEKYSADHKKDI
jgi:hypothetical protein